MPRLVTRSRFARVLHGSVLSGDSLDATTISEEDYKREMLANSRALVAAQKHWADGDRTLKILAIAATLAIPLTAAIWRALGIGRKRKKP